jgi:hypothetical protein
MGKWLGKLLISGKVEFKIKITNRITNYINNKREFYGHKFPVYQVM